MTAELTDIDALPTHGRQPAICELTCANCGDGLRFDQFRCMTCGTHNPRFISKLQGQ